MSLLFVISILRCSDFPILSFTGTSDHSRSTLPLVRQDSVLRYHQVALMNGHPIFSRKCSRLCSCSHSRSLSLFLLITPLSVYLHRRKEYHSLSQSQSTVFSPLSSFVTLFRSALTTNNVDVLSMKGKYTRNRSVIGLLSSYCSRK